MCHVSHLQLSGKYLDPSVQGFPRHTDVKSKDWLESDPGPRPGRGEVLSHILRAAVDQRGGDEFKNEMLLTMSVEVVWTPNRDIERSLSLLSLTFH